MKIFYAAILLLAVVNAKVHRRTSEDMRNQVKDLNKQYLIKTNRAPKTHVEKVPRQDVFSTENLCDECKDVVTKIDAVIQSQERLDELKAMLNLVCDYLPSETYKQECKNLVANLDVIAHEIQPLLANPEQFCTNIHLCGMGSTNKVLRILMRLAKRQLSFARLSGGDALCDECKFGVTEAKTLWDQKSTQDEVKQVLEQVCSYLGEYKDECDNLVNQYFPLLVQEVDQLLSDPQAACSAMGLCSSLPFLSIHGFNFFPAEKGQEDKHAVSQSAITLLLRRMGRVQTRSGKSTGCTVCVYSIGAVLEAIKADPNLLTNWANGLKSVCNAFPEGAQAGCNDFLSIYLEPVLRVAVDSVSAKEICDFVHACTASRYEELMTYEHVRASSEVVCESCKLLATFLKSELQNKQFQDEIKGELEQICNFVPGQYAGKCEEIVDLYVPYLLDLLVTELDPDTVCPDLNLCPPKVNAVPPAELSSESNEVAEQQAEQPSRVDESEVSEELQELEEALEEF